MQDKHFLPSNQRYTRLVKKKIDTNPEYGKSPSERTVDELLENGLIILDKPQGPTSHQVDSWVEKILNKKVGHSGTLDPNATGILPIGLGSSTKALQYILSAGKEYVGIMTLHKDVSEDQIKKICRTFVGDVVQLPPVRSAVKRVRRKRSVHYLHVLEINGRDVLIRVGCESGTYVRTLCVDIGRKLKTGAHLAELRRTKVGTLTEEEIVNLHDVKDAKVFLDEDKDESWIRKVVHPVEKMLEHVPKIVIRDSAVNALCHGADLNVPGVVEIDSDIKKGDIAAVLTLKGEAVAVVKMLMSTEDVISNKTGVVANLDRVIMKKDIYPSIWKKG